MIGVDFISAVLNLYYQMKIMFMFSLKKMASGKINIDSSSRYIPKNGKTQERDGKPETIKNNPLPRKQNENISQK